MEIVFGLFQQKWFILTGEEDLVTFDAESLRDEPGPNQRTKGRAALSGLKMWVFCGLSKRNKHLGSIFHHTILVFFGSLFRLVCWCCG